MKVAILGSGFGLYGYLPALLAAGGHVILPRRYELRLAAREDVKHLLGDVEWAGDEHEALDKAEAVVIAQRPGDQVAWIGEMLCRPQVGAVLLEKPVAPDPLEAADIIEKIEGSGRRLRIGYTLRYTGWAERLLDALRTPASSTDEIDIVWSFRAHHYSTGATNWKRFVSSGGGALRFYGIHLIALLAEGGYIDAASSTSTGAMPDEAESWQATLIGPGLPKCRVSIYSNASDKTFVVRGPPAMGADISLADPFDQLDLHGNLDRRFAAMNSLCNDFLRGDSLALPWYRDTTALWGRVEAHNRMLPAEQARL